MPKYEITAPDGRKFEVTAPDGATQDQVMAYAQKQFSSMPEQQKQEKEGFLDFVRRQPMEASDAFGHHVGNFFHGAAQFIENKAADAADKYAPGSSIAKSLRDSANQTNAAMTKREQEYQANVPDSPGSYAGAALGTIAPAVLTMGGSTAPQAAQTVSRAGNAVQLGKNVAKGAGIGAAYATTAPVLNATDSQSFNDTKNKQIVTGAVVGGGLPVVGAAGRYVGNSLYSLVEPFTKAGQDSVVRKIINNFADGGPTTLNNAQIVPGSVPTLAEATGNSGIATLQRSVRDLRPNAFVEREQQNAAARTALFDKVAGDTSSISSAQLARDQAAQPILRQAFKDAKTADPQRVVDMIDTILQGPAGKRDAVVTTLSNIKSKLYDASGNLEQNAANLYGVRKQIGDLLDKRAAISNPAAQQATRELIAIRNQLDRAIEKAAPGFKDYLSTYREKSQPINAMEALQGLKLTDAQGNITLPKVQNAIASLERDMSAKGANGAKSLSSEQLNALRAIRDDLLRQSSLGGGKSIGSNTFQNLATDNILASFLPGRVASFAGDRFGGVLGQVGRLAYSGPNEAIRNRLVDAMLAPEVSLMTLNRGNAALSSPLANNALMNRLAPYNVPLLTNGANNALLAPVVPQSR